MAQSTQTSAYSYKQGYSDSTLATHLLRTAEVEAGFLLPYIKKDHHILDVGCGPGSITVGFIKYASEGRVVGVDMSEKVLLKAKELATQNQMPTEGPGSVAFEQANVLERLPYADGTFDVVYCGQMFGHLPLPDMPLRAMAEIRRVMKQGAVLATRDGVAQHFFPRRLDLERLWVKRFARVVSGSTDANADTTGSLMPSFFRRAGFNNTVVNGGTTIWATAEARRWLANRGINQLQKGDPFYQSWLDAGFTEYDIQETVDACKEWANAEDGWCGSLQCECLGWK